MKKLWARFECGVRAIGDQIVIELKPFRVKYYSQFILSVFSFGFAGIYFLYVWVRLPVFPIHISTTFYYNFQKAILSADLAGFFFALNPVFDLLSSVFLFGGGLWVAQKMWCHSLVKISEVEYIPLAERISEIEKEGEGICEG